MKRYQHVISSEAFHSLMWHALLGIQLASDVWSVLAYSPCLGAKNHRIVGKLLILMAQ